MLVAEEFLHFLDLKRRECALPDHSEDTWRSPYVVLLAGLAVDVFQICRSEKHWFELFWVRPFVRIDEVPA